MKLPGSHCYLFPFYVAILFSCFNVHGLAAASLSRRLGNNTDQQALLEFKAKITGDRLGIMPFWNNTVHFCRWYGVSCSHRRQRVTKLELPSLKLVGAVSPFIGNLSFLKVLNLQNNSFSQAIPQEIGRLHRLRELRLGNNSLGDKIPSNMSGCSKLEIFRVAHNLLEGGIPSVLGSLSHLKELSLAGNKLTGSIPPSLGNLSALEAISLAVNKLSGRIPEGLGRLTNITFFSLEQNEISGIIPASIFNLSNIRTFDIGGNQLQGNLPSSLGITMPYLEILSVRTNKLTGSIPVLISNASNLFELQFQQNELSGSVPSFEKLFKLSRLTIYENHLGSGGATDLSFVCSLINSTSLEYLEINNNNLGGLFPECISNLSSLSYLIIHDNKIFGSIPPGIQSLINLEWLLVSDNLLSGPIPQGVGRLQKMSIFAADINFLSGSIPTSLGNLTVLFRLYLDHNNFLGSIPSDLGKCENLIDLYLSANNLTDSIPPEVIGLSSLSVSLDLSSNQLTGTLPAEVGTLKNLILLDVSSNKLSGVLPDNLGSCLGLDKLYLGGNFFQGPIPSSLRFLRGLKALDISGNNISGEIPSFLQRFESLLYLNLSFNDLEGPLPTEGIFTNVSGTFVQGNDKLCGGAPMFHLPRCNLKISNNRWTDSLKFKVAIGFAIVGVTLVFSFLLLCFRKKKQQPIATTGAGDSLLKLSYQSVLKATDGFSSEHLIGSGSFGSVYKGILEENGAVIAVKVLNLLSRGASKSFLAECEALKNIRHRNLVKLLTAISGVDYEGNDFKALVYEFMQNGSLEDWLHPSTGVQKGTVKHLTLLQRVNVAAHVAGALEYLQHHCETPIIHCDLKPSNILLDEEMVGHVGDFGLAKILATETPNHPTNQSSSFGLRGTIGYAPPEYGLGSEVSTKGDVYSYGILLLEMFTGKRPTDDMFKEGLSLRSFVAAGMAGLGEIIDPVLLFEERHDRHFQYLKSIFEIGLACSTESPNQRMDMSAVAAKLCSIRDKLVHPTRVRR